MSRLTASDVQSMMEAYAAVYAPQEKIELTEEQVWEEVEAWVNSLLEEGYDLSEYTWEEMYEEYLRESLHLKEFFGPGMEKARYGSPERTTRQRLDLGVVKGGGTSGYTVSTTDKPKPGESTQQWQTRRTQALSLADRLNKETGQGRYRPAAPSRSASTAPASTAPSRSASTAPGAPKPAPAPKPPETRMSTVTGKREYVGTTPSGEKFERRAATGAELRAAQKARSSAILDLKTKPEAEKAAVQAGINAAKPTPAPTPTPTPSPTPTPTPSAPKPSTRQLSAADKRQGIKASYEYDAYDLVLEYLLSEGHADTVEEANYVMLEMDAEMVQSIIESYLIEEETPLQKIRRRNKEYFRNNPETVQKTTQRRAEHKSVRGEKKEKGAKSVFGTMRNIGGPYR